MHVLKLAAPKNRDEVKQFFNQMITPMSCSLTAKCQEILLAPESLARDIYTTATISEKFNCSYSLNSQYKNHLTASDMLLSGRNPDGETRIIEITDHPFFLAMLFQPQLNSAPEHPHPVIYRFFKACQGK
ncbi:hypothetical protein [Desulfosediminicola sp.]|uniref:hypothetical protein n=1 Tax=Desulfosediminicola sp. TaxID=2886825 RepID=UPI003AF2A5A7